MPPGILAIEAPWPVCRPVVMEYHADICVKAVAPDADISGAHPVRYIGLTSQALCANGSP
jgi:hypothetical protein